MEINKKKQAERVNRRVRQINKYASDISKCLEGMPCDICRKQVFAEVSSAVADIENEQRLLRLALSRLEMTNERSGTHV